MMKYGVGGGRKKEKPTNTANEIQENVKII